VITAYIYITTLNVNNVIKIMLFVYSSITQVDRLQLNILKANY